MEREVGCALCGTTRSIDWVGCDRIRGKVVCIDCLDELNSQKVNVREDFRRKGKGASRSSRKGEEYTEELIKG